MREGLEVTTASGRVRLWPYRDIRQTQGFYAGEEVRLERGGELRGGCDRAGSARSCDSLHEAAPRPVRLPRSRGTGPAGAPHRPGGRCGHRHHRGALSLGHPALAALAAPRVPVAWEESLGRAVTDQLAPPDRAVRDPRGQRALDEIVARLTAAAPPSPYTFRARVVNRP